MGINISLHKQESETDWGIYTAEVDVLVTMLKREFVVIEQLTHDERQAIIDIVQSATRRIREEFRTERWGGYDGDSGVDRPVLGQSGNPKDA